MLAYIVKNSKEKPALLGSHTYLGYDIPSGGKVWHLDLPNLSVPVIPHDGIGVHRIDDTLSVFRFGRTPEPHELLKRKVPCGNPIALGDGKLWHVPMVRNIYDGTFLPKKVALTDAGIELIPKHEYLEAYKAGEDVWKVMRDEWPSEKEFTLLDILKLYATILGVNYILTPYDVMLYGIYCEETCHSFYYEATDAHTWVQMQEGEQQRKKQ